MVKIGVWILLLVTSTHLYTKTVDFTIFTFNDVYDIHPQENNVGGFSKFHTILKKYRKQVRNHITTMNGDFLSPSVLSSLDKGRHRIELFNAMGVDLVVLGNHEFDFGPEVVKERIKESNFPWLAANVYDTDGNYFTGEKQTHIVDIDGVKIGFFGVITNETPMLSSTQNSALFCPLRITAKRMCQKLKEEGADVIVALTHLFFKEDRELAKEVPEIDVILGGHDHDPMIFYEHGTLIMKTGQNAYFLGKIDLQIEVLETEGKKNVQVYPSWEIVLNRNIEPDYKIQEYVDKYDNDFAKLLEPIGYVKTSLDSRHGVVRGQESSMANFILDVLRETFHADAALIGGGCIRGDRYYGPNTPITQSDLFRELPFDNENVVVEVSGRAIVEALEHGVSHVEHLAGRFLQVSGISYIYNGGKNPGERIIDVKIGGKPLEEHKLYKLVTNTYIQSGGDGFFSLCNGSVIKTPEQAGKVLDCVVSYLKTHPEIYAKEDGRIQKISVPSTLDMRNQWTH